MGARAHGLLLLCFFWSACDSTLAERSEVVVEALTQAVTFPCDPGSPNALQLVAAPGPASPTVVDFGKAVLGADTRRFNVRLQNCGDTPLANNRATPPALPFGGYFGGCRGTLTGPREQQLYLLSPGQICDVWVEFSPRTQTTAGAYEGAVHFSYQRDGAAETSIIALKGQLFAPPVLAFEGTVPESGLPATAIGSSSQVILKFRNNGQTRIQSLAASFKPNTKIFLRSFMSGTVLGEDEGLRIEPDDRSCTGTLYAGQLCRVRITFNPILFDPGRIDDSVGGYEGIVLLSYDDGTGSRTLELPVGARSVLPGNLILLGADPVDLAAMRTPGVPLRRMIYVKNVGGGTVTNLRLSGLENGFFLEGGVFPGTGGSCGASLRAGQQCRFEVLFDTAAPGRYRTELSLSYEDGLTTRVVTKRLLARGPGTCYEDGFTITHPGALAAIEPRYLKVVPAFSAPGRVYAFGFGYDGQTPVAFSRRLLCGGDPDLAYGDGGHVLVDLTDNRQPFAVPYFAASHKHGFVARGSATNDIVVWRWNGDGRPDTTLAGTGKVAITIPDTGQSELPMVRFVHPLADGSLLIAFWSFENDFQLAKITAAGTLDQSFGESGFFRYQASHPLTMASMTVQTDNRIVLLGETRVSDSSWPFVLRLNADGSQDPGFAAGTVAYSSSHFVSMSPTEIAQTSGGQLLIVGQGSYQNIGTRGTVVRLFADGRPDPAFGPARAGFALVANSYAWGLLDSVMTRLADGKFIVTGESFLTRLLADGEIDPSFGVDGVVTTPDRQIVNPRQAPDGRLLYTTNGQLRRVQADGSPEPVGWWE